MKVLKAVRQFFVLFFLVILSDGALTGVLSKAQTVKEYFNSNQYLTG